MKKIAAVLLGLWSAVYLIPVFYLFAGSFTRDDLVLRGEFSAANWQMQNYPDVFLRVDFIRYLFNSLWINALIVILGLAVNSTAGYALARLRFDGRNLVLVLVLALMIVPLESIAVPLYYQVTVLGLRDTYTVQVLPFVANALFIYLFYSFFLDFPVSLEEAARLDGASVWRIFFYVVIPNNKAIFATVAVLTFLAHWGSLLWPLMVTVRDAVRPLPLALAGFYTLPPLQWGDIMAFGVMMVLPVLVMFLVFQRWFIRGALSSGIKG